MSSQVFFKSVLFVGPHAGAREAFVDLVLAVLLAQRGVDGQEDAYPAEAPRDKTLEAAASMEDIPPSGANAPADADASGTTVAIDASLGSHAALHVASEPRLSTVASFIAHLVAVVRAPWLPDMFRSYGSFFLLLEGVARLGPHERVWMLRLGVVEACVKFYSGERKVQGFNVRQGGWDDTSVPSSMSPPNCWHLSSTLSLVLRQAHTEVTGPLAKSVRPSPPDQLPGPCVALSAMCVIVVCVCVCVCVCVHWLKWEGILGAASLLWCVESNNDACLCLCGLSETEMLLGAIDAAVPPRRKIHFLPQLLVDDHHAQV